MKIGGMVGQQDGSDAVYIHDEAFVLHSSDHPGMTLVSVLLNGENYLYVVYRLYVKELKSHIGKTQFLLLVY